MDAAKSTHDDICCRNGSAVCARYKLALEHDMRIASESAKFDTRFLKLGLYLGGGDTRKLLRTVNWSQALLLLLPGQSIEARAAHPVRLVEFVMPGSNLIQQSLPTLRKSAAVSREVVLKSKQTMQLAETCGPQAEFVHETGEQKCSLEQPDLAQKIARVQQR
jgi:enoyl-CoA hydratase